MMEELKYGVEREEPWRLPFWELWKGEYYESSYRVYIGLKMI